MKKLSEVDNMDLISKEKDIVFYLMKPAYCQKCNKIILHEHGRHKKSGVEVKECISCRSITMAEEKTTAQVG